MLKSIIHLTGKQCREGKIGLLRSLHLAADKILAAVFLSRNKRGWNGMRLKRRSSALLLDRKCLDVSQLYELLLYSLCYSFKSDCRCQTSVQRAVTNVCKTPANEIS